MTTFSDRLLEETLDVLLNSPNQTFSLGDPGEVLQNLTTAVNPESENFRSRYTQVCAVVVELEKMGWVKVERLYHDESARANHVAAIQVIV